MHHLYTKSQVVKPRSTSQPVLRVPYSPSAYVTLCGQLVIRGLGSRNPLICAFLGFPPPEEAEGHSPDRRHLVGKPILFAFAPLGAAIVTNLGLKPHAEA